MRSILLLTLFAACDWGGGSTPPPTNFELACDSADTASQTQLYCIRTDTRNGDVLRVDYNALPVSAGSTAGNQQDAETFTTVCHATSTNTTAELYCIRMNRVTGDMLLINLQQVGSLPASTK
jgi:hypothetical protein